MRRFLILWRCTKVASVTPAWMHPLIFREWTPRRCAKTSSVMPACQQYDMSRVWTPRRCSNAASVMPALVHHDMSRVWTPRRCTKAAFVTPACLQCDMLSVWMPRKCAKAASVTPSCQQFDMSSVWINPFNGTNAAFVKFLQKRILIFKILSRLDFGLYLGRMFAINSSSVISFLWHRLTPIANGNILRNSVSVTSYGIGWS